MNAERARYGPAEGHRQQLHAHRARKTGRDRADMVAEPLERRRDAADAARDPFGMEDEQRPEDIPATLALYQDVLELEG